MAYFELEGETLSGTEYLRDYYAFTGPFADRIAAGLLTSEGALKEFLDGYREAGCDHLILFPSVAHLDQIERLAETLGRLPQ